MLPTKHFYIIFINIMSYVFQILSAIVNIYSIICFIYIMLSWFPGARFTKFGKFVSSLCEPYMELFSRFRWFTFGHIDFSPIISIGLLSLLSSILGGITSTGRIYFGGILATVIFMIWNIISTFLSILVILLIVRLIVLLVKKGVTPYNSAWYQIDQFLGKITYKITSIFVKKSFSYKKSLIVSLIVFALLTFVGRIVITLLINLCYAIPF